MPPPPKTVYESLTGIDAPVNAPGPTTWQTLKGEPTSAHYPTPAIVTRHYAATPGARERVTARWGLYQATCLWIPEYREFVNHQRVASLLCLKHHLRGRKWVAVPRNPRSWVFVDMDEGWEVQI